MLFTEQIKNTRGAGSHGRRHVFCCYCAGRCWSVEGAVVTLDWLNWTSTALIDWWFFLPLPSRCSSTLHCPLYVTPCVHWPTLPSDICCACFAIFSLTVLFVFVDLFYFKESLYCNIFKSFWHSFIIYFLKYFYLSSLFTSLDLAVRVLVISVSCFILLHPSYFFKMGFFVRNYIYCFNWCSTGTSTFFK